MYTEFKGLQYSAHHPHYFNLPSSNNLNSPEAIVSRTLDNWFTNNDGSEMSFYIHERVDEWPESTSLIGGKKRSSSVQDSISQIVPFHQLFVCPPSPYNAVEISTLVNKIAKKIGCCLAVCFD